MSINLYKFKLKLKINKKNIQLFHFFEDELIEKYEIIESILKNKLGLSNKTLLADCIIKEVNFKKSNEFLIKNHIQGNTNSLIKIGLYNF